MISGDVRGILGLAKLGHIQPFLGADANTQEDEGGQGAGARGDHQSLLRARTHVNTVTQQCAHTAQQRRCMRRRCLAASATRARHFLLRQRLLLLLLLLLWLRL